MLTTGIPTTTKTTHTHTQNITPRNIVQKHSHTAETGPTLSKTALQVPECSSAQTRAVRRLWRHWSASCRRPSYAAKGLISCPLNLVSGSIILHNNHNNNSDTNIASNTHNSNMTLATVGLVWDSHDINFASNSNNCNMIIMTLSLVWDVG